jgi:hypothetical protein
MSGIGAAEGRKEAMTGSRTFHVTIAALRQSNFILWNMALQNEANQALHLIASQSTRPQLFL